MQRVPPIADTCLADRWITRLCALLVCLTLSPTVWAAQVLLSGAEDTPIVQAFTAALAQQRPADNVRFSPVDQLPMPSQLPAETRLILLDVESLDWRLKDTQGPPTLVLRISRVQAHQRLGETRPGRLSLLWSDPPPARQLLLAQRLLPQARRIGVLYDLHSEFLLRELHSAAKPLGLEIIDQPWAHPEDNQPVQSLLKNSDLLLGLDDPDLYNAQTVKNLLLSTYARQQTLLGPTASFIKAGSLASTYTDQNEWLTIINELLDQPPARWPRAMYPDRFKVVSNPQVARSLGIEHINDSAVAAQIAKEESSR
ncbi:MAG: transporter substrate-binding protein [Pseudomonas sp.]|nr:transporter substrate-binding protein [Pseudomonas sp.]